MTELLDHLFWFLSVSSTFLSRCLSLGVRHVFETGLTSDYGLDVDGISLRFIGSIPTFWLVSKIQDVRCPFFFQPWNSGQFNWLTTLLFFLTHSREVSLYCFGSQRCYTIISTVGPTLIFFYDLYVPSLFFIEYEYSFSLVASNMTLVGLQPYSFVRRSSSKIWYEFLYVCMLLRTSFFLYHCCFL